LWLQLLVYFAQLQLVRRGLMLALPLQIEQVHDKKRPESFVAQMNSINALPHRVTKNKFVCPSNRWIAFYARLRESDLPRWFRLGQSQPKRIALLLIK